MTEPTTVQSWARSLGLTVNSGQQPDELCATTESGARVVVRRRTHEVWEVVHERHLTSAGARATWMAPADDRGPAEVMADLVRQLAMAYPLVEGELMMNGEDLKLRLWAPVYDEG